MNDELTFLQFAPAAVICALGVALAVAQRRRLGRAAPLAFAGFIVLAVAQIALLAWSEGRESTIDGAATPEEVVDTAYSAAWLRALLGGLSAAGFILLLAAVVADRRAGDAAAPR